MAVSFAPASGGQSLPECDLRLALVTANSGAKSDSARWMGIDFRVSPSVTQEWGLRSGDRVVGLREDDGSWVIRIVHPTEKGFTVRIGGVRGHQGRKGCAYFRFSCTPDTARDVFPDSEVFSCDLVGIEGRAAYFAVSAVTSGREFVPAR